MCGQVEHCALSKEDVACPPLDQQQQKLDTEQLKEASSGGADNEELPKQQLKEEYQELYHKSVADYEHARSQVVKFDEMIAKLRREIASVESTTGTTTSSTISSSG